MAILIRNAYVFAPKELGATDVLMVGEKILAVGPNLSVSLPGLSVIDASGFLLVPGFVDPHVHVLGGGGVGGPITRAPAITAGELIRAGITTVVGVLGADVMTRKLPDLLAKVRELNALGLSAWMYTSSFRYPPVTLSQSVADDVARLRSARRQTCHGRRQRIVPLNRGRLGLVVSNPTGCRHRQKAGPFACSFGGYPQSV